MLPIRNKARLMSVLMTLAMLLSFANVSPAFAAPQYEVRGQAKAQLFGDDVSVSHVSVNAWLDKNGVAQGKLTWIGGVSPEALPTAYPWQMDVTSIDFLSDNTAKVCWVVVHAVVPGDIGFSDCFVFTDNGATGTPDMINEWSIEAGNIIVG